MVCEREGDRDKHWYETFSLRRPRFYATSLLKIEAKQIFHEYHVIATRIVTKKFLLKQERSYLVEETFLHHYVLRYAIWYH